MSRPWFTRLRPVLRRKDLSGRRRASASPDLKDWQGQLPPVRMLGPAAFCVGAVGTLFLGLAAFEVHRDAKAYHNYWRQPASSVSQLDNARLKYRKRPRRGPGGGRDSRISNSDIPLNSTVFPDWETMTEIQKAVIGTIGVTATCHFAPKLLHRMVDAATLPPLAHIPVSGRNYDMFTSLFTHGSNMHLALNMYCLYNFGSSVARDLDYSGSHFTAFYLSSGILASMGAQIEALAPSRRFYAGVGASGAISAMVGFFAMQNPNARLGIIFVPGSLDAQTALAAFAAFEAYGAVFGIPFVRWGHSVHLAGLAVGAAYAHFDGQGRTWAAARRLAFDGMRRLELV